MVLFSSAVWFARTDMCTHDNYFRGFPAAWNLVVTSFLLLNSAPWLNVAIVMVLGLLSVTPVKFAHIVRVVEFRRVTVPVFSAWLAAMAYLSAIYPRTNSPIKVLLLVGPAYYLGLTVRRTWWRRAELPAATSPAPAAAGALG